MQRSSICAIRRSILARVKFLSRLFTALNLLPSIAWRSVRQEMRSARRPAGRRDRRPSTRGAQGGACRRCLASGTQTKSDQESIKLVISGVAGCEYCVAAHSLLGKLAALKPEELKKIRDGEPTGDVHRDALIRFTRTLAETSGTVEVGQ